MKQVIGIDIGGTNFRIGYVSREGELSFFEKCSSQKLLGENAVMNLKEEIEAYMERHQLNEKVLAVTIGVPSMVSKDKSFVFSTPNLKGLENIDLGHKLSELLKIPVLVDRDVNYLLINDIKKYNLDPDRTKTVLGMYFGTGLGNAVYINGHLHVGKNGAAGELGHIPLYGLEEKCPCGNVGCAELKCSGIHLTRICKEYFPETDISEVFTKYADTRIVKEYVDTLAIPMSAEITILDPDYVVMGGGVISMKDFPISRLIEQIKMRARKPYPSENLEFVFPDHTQVSGVVGGAYSAYEIMENGCNQAVH